MKKSTIDLLLLCGGGFLAGVANGLLGAGGGVIIIFALTRLLSGENLDKRDIFANALCVIFVLSLVSFVIYAIRGSVDLAGFAPYAIPAVVGGLIGGLLLGKLSTTLLHRVFAALLVYSGIMLMVR